MKQQVLNNFDMPWLPITALIIFVICFSIFTWWTFQKSRKNEYAMMSQIPLDEAKEIKDAQ